MGDNDEWVNNIANAWASGLDLPAGEWNDAVATSVKIASKEMQAWSESDQKTIKSKFRMMVIRSQKVRGDYESAIATFHGSAASDINVAVILCDLSQSDDLDAIRDHYYEACK